jgi:hypothetical protein
MATMAPKTTSYETILTYFRACRGLYILGAGASWPEAPLGEDVLVGPGLDYVRHSGSFPAAIPGQSELNQRIIGVCRAIPICRVFPDPIDRFRNDFLHIEILERLPGLHARLFMKHELSRYRYSGRLSDSYRVFQFFHPAMILNYNLDGVATDSCGSRHRVVDAHGTIERGYGAPRVAALRAEAREFDGASVPDDLLMCVPESYDDLRLANRLLQVERFFQKSPPDFIAIIGYSFGRNGDSYDDRVSLDFFQQPFRGFQGNIYVMEPKPDLLRDMLAERIKSNKVVSVRAHWNVLAHAFLEEICCRNQKRSLNYVCEQILDRYGSRTAFP